MALALNPKSKIETKSLARFCFVVESLALPPFSPFHHSNKFRSMRRCFRGSCRRIRTQSRSTLRLLPRPGSPILPKFGNESVDVSFPSHYDGRHNRSRARRGDSALSRLRYLETDPRGREHGLEGLLLGENVGDGGEGDGGGGAGARGIWEIEEAVRGENGEARFQVLGSSSQRRSTPERKKHSISFGGCYQQSDKALNLVALSVMRMPPFSPKPIAIGTRVRGFHEHRFSTLADVSHEPAPDVDDLLSFIKSSLDELEGTHHYWLNRSGKNKEFFGSDRIFLVLAARIFECGIMFQKLKTVQERFPHIIIMGLKLTHSSDRVNLIQLLMTENITFPILLSQRTFSQIEKGACYILFKNFSSPIVFDVEDVGLEILYEAVQLLQMQPSDDSSLVNVLRCTSLKQDDITKDQYICSPLQNLLLYYPGCVSADESAKRLFISDCNHHRIIVCNGSGEIMDCIGSSAGFEDGDFESAKLRCPAGSYYHATEDCLYFVDSENHTIRRADMGARIVETLYPTSTLDKGGVRIWNWIMSKLGLESSVQTIVEERSEVFDSKSLCFPWHLLKSVDDTFYIIDRRFQTLWTMDFGLGKIDEVFEGSTGILEICGQLIMKKLSILHQIPCDWFQQRTNNGCVLEGFPQSDLLSSLTTLQNHVFICDKVRQRIIKFNIESRDGLDFQLSNLGILGLPYWLNSPLEIFYASGNGLSDTAIDHLQHFDLLPGRIDIKLSVDVPMDIDLVEPLQESCIWRQARGAATEISGANDVPESLDKVGAAQQWYNELDNLASPKPESEMTEDDNLDKNVVVEDEKVRISCSVFTSPGTSELILFAVLYCKLRRVPNSNEGNQEKYASRILDILSSKRYGKRERDLWHAFLMQSKGDLRDIVFMKPLHIRIRLNSFDHPKADNGRDIILTDTSIKVKVVLN